MCAQMLQPRAYTFKQAEALTTFTRATWYRWEKNGQIRLVRTANKTLVPAEEIDRVMAGEAVLHPRAGWRNRQPLRPRRPGRPRKVQPPPSSSEVWPQTEVSARRVAAKAERAAQNAAGVAKDSTSSPQPAD
jgi:hypothetical protein